MAKRDKRNGVSFRHSKNVKSKVSAAQLALGLGRHEIARFNEQAQLLASKQLEPQEYFNAVLDDILDITIAEQPLRAGNEKNVLNAILNINDAEQKASAEKQLERALQRRTDLLTDILTRYESERNNGNKDIAGTGWAAWNAVTEHADHSPLWRNNGEARQKAESRFESNLTGRSDEIKATALELALERTK